MPPLKSLEAAVASWPEYATAVGLTLLPDYTIRVIAPYGLNDLFAMVIEQMVPIAPVTGLSVISCSRHILVPRRTYASQTESQAGRTAGDSR
ncbi:hypothetical protein BGLA2_1580010 [Burkholderia gladioli]|uniref:nucleotidyltransferase family protein n=1 Tax=Burkholderia gladioli TaxID=28095 RepID=UPI001CAF8C3D|nr:nucleotidyltransferase family protein [Burkholderia gladioli]CAG9202444.1 hypothetical protein BGLA2_1580010 [Burkholderia gladioli]